MINGIIKKNLTFSVTNATIKPVYYTLSIQSYDTSKATVVATANRTSFNVGSKQFVSGTTWTASASSSDYDVTLSATSGILNSNYTITVKLTSISSGK